MGSYLDKHKIMGTSFLPTATAWDFSPPQLHQYYLGQPQAQVVLAVVRMKRRANLHVDSPFHCQFISIFHFTSVPRVPTFPLPRVTTLFIHRSSLSLPHPQGPVMKIPRRKPSIPIPGFTWEMGCICSRHSLLYKVFWSLGNCTSLPNISNVEPDLGTPGSWEVVLGGWGLEVDSPGDIFQNRYPVSWVDSKMSSPSYLRMIIFWGLWRVKYLVLIWPNSGPRLFPFNPGIQSLGPAIFIL